MQELYAEILKIDREEVHGGVSGADEGEAKAHGQMFDYMLVEGCG